MYLLVWILAIKGMICTLPSLFPCFSLLEYGSDGGSWRNYLQFGEGKPWFEVSGRKGERYLGVLGWIMLSCDCYLRCQRRYTYVIKLRVLRRGYFQVASKYEGTHSRETRKPTKKVGVMIIQASSWNDLLSGSQPTKCKWPHEVRNCNETDFHLTIKCKTAFGLLASESVRE